MYQISVSSRARKDIKKLPSGVQKRVVLQIATLKTNRFPQQFKPLKGKEIASYRLRIGDYRVLYDIYRKDETVYIIRVGHRRDIYR